MEWKRKSALGNRAGKRGQVQKGYIRKEEEEEQEGRKQQLYESNVLETAESPFWDLTEELPTW